VNFVAACDAAALAVERLSERLSDTRPLEDRTGCLLAEIGSVVTAILVDLQVIDSVDEAKLAEQLRLLRAVNCKIANLEGRWLATLEPTMSATDQPIAGLTESIEEGLQRFTVYWVLEGPGEYVDVWWRSSSSAAWERKHRFDSPGRIEIDLGAGEVRLLYSSQAIGRNALADVCRVKPQTGPVEYFRHTLH
jgi:hypothetical protein